MAATQMRALSFETLLKRTAETHGLATDFTKDPYLLKSLPQIASQITDDLVKKGTDIARAKIILRKTIADLCNLLPHPSEKARFASALRNAAPSWVVTTNYDLILEALMEHGHTVFPHQILFPSKDRVPIFHLHGHRYEPQTIRVTEEDYVSLLAPIDYQRLKLPLLFLESTTLLIGYSLGDINVRAAMEWSRSFRKDEQGQTPAGRVIQAFFTSKPSGHPRIGPNEEIIIETGDVPALLEEIGSAANNLSSWDAYLQSDFQQFFASANPIEIAEPGGTRDRFLEMVEHAVGDIASEDFIAFVKRALDPIWEQARKAGGFGYYKEFLSVLMAVLAKLKYRDANPNVIAYLAIELDRIGGYFDERERAATAWHATRLWKGDAPTLDPHLLRELRSFAVANNLYGLISMMDCSTLKKVFET